MEDKELVSTAGFYYTREAYTLEQLLQSVPAMVLAHLQRKVLREHRALVKEDFFAIFREPRGTINSNAVEAACAEIKASEMSLGEQFAACAEIERYLPRKTAVQLSALSRFSLFVSENLPQPAYQDPVHEPEPPAPQHFFNPRNIGEPNVGDQPPPGFRQAQIPREDVGYLRTQSLDAGAALGAEHQQYMTTPPPFSTHEGALKAPDIAHGSLSQAFRKLPNWRNLGITRAAGEATEDELRAFIGTVMPDGSPVTGKAFFSSASFLVGNDVIPQLMAFVPTVELERVKAMLEARSIKSDQDHSRNVMSGPFTVVNPHVGSDASTKLHIDHPYLGKVPYTGVTARCLFPIMQFDAAQMAATEAAQRGKLSNLSITFGYEYLHCGLCGEMKTREVLRANGQVIGFTLNPDDNPELFASADDDDEWDYWMRPAATFRVKADVEGGYMFRSCKLTSVTTDGMAMIDPIPEGTFFFDTGGDVLIDMPRYWWGYRPSCRFHGQIGVRLRDGRMPIGMFGNVQSLINVAAVDAGAIADARLVLSPDVAY